MIPFNKPIVIPNELRFLKEVIHNNSFSGDGKFTKECNKWLKHHFHTNLALLTTSCTHALEFSSIMINIREGDEIIMPSFTFVSTANAFVIRGAKIVFCDIRPDTMNINQEIIEEAITPKTKAIVAVHYGGVGCEMDRIIEIGRKNNLFIIEDAAHCINSTYKGTQLGSIGHFGTLSFHETKNFQCGEGGAILINDSSFCSQAEIIKDKGTNINKFRKGTIDKYSWIDVGSSYSPSEFNAAFLYAQFEMAEKINWKRKKLWNYYNENLKHISENGFIELQFVPEYCKPNGHIFYIKLKDTKERDKMILYLKNKGIQSVFHYVPLHNSIGGKKYGRFNGEDNFTTIESQRLLRLPLYYDLKLTELEYICESVKEFFKV